MKNREVYLRNAYRTALQVYQHQISNMGGTKGIVAYLDKDVDIQKEFEAKSDLFNHYINNISMQITKTKYVEPIAYAALVGSLAKELGKEYSIYFSLSEISGTDECKRLTDSFNEKKSDTNEHPLPINSIFVKVGDTVYENYRNKVDNITHVDEIEYTEDYEEEDTNENTGSSETTVGQSEKD